MKFVLLFFVLLILFGLLNYSISKTYKIWFKWQNIAWEVSFYSIALIAAFQFNIFNWTIGDAIAYISASFMSGTLLALAYRKKIIS